MSMAAEVTFLRNRKGRKRKSGRRKPSGDIIHVRTDYREMAALTPHRISLPAAYRTDFRAETILGRMNIVWRTSSLPSAIRPGIPDEEYEAGARYERLVRSYLNMANAPRIAQLRSLMKSDIDRESAPDASRLRSFVMDDEALTERYMRAHEAVSGHAGRPGHMAVNRAVVHDQPCSADQLVHLRTALQALARHFGLTNHRK